MNLLKRNIPGSTITPTLSPTEHLWNAIQNGDTALVLEGLQAKVMDINEQNSNGMTLLMCAACAGHTEIMIMLMEDGANVDMRNSMLDTALILAARNARVEACHALLDFNANIHFKNRAGSNALMEACDVECEEIYQRLIDNGAKLDRFDRVKFEDCVKNGKFVLLKTYISMGLNDVTDPYYIVRYLKQAIDSKHKNAHLIINLILNQEGINPLYLQGYLFQLLILQNTTQEYVLPIAELLINKGVDLMGTFESYTGSENYKYEVNFSGKTPAMIAKEMGYTTLHRFILTHIKESSQSMGKSKLSSPDATWTTAAFASAPPMPLENQKTNDQMLYSSPTSGDCLEGFATTELFSATSVISYNQQGDSEVISSLPMIEENLNEINPVKNNVEHESQDYLPGLQSYQDRLKTMGIPSTFLLDMLHATAEKVISSLEQAQQDAMGDAMVFLANTPPKVADSTSLARLGKFATSSSYEQQKLDNAKELSQIAP